ncbi:MAG: hypothetical protein M3Q80_02880, partial [bacterium]|nr:hypothetical protein [bacterium]
MKKNNSVGIYIGIAVIILLMSFFLVWWQSRASSISEQSSSLDIRIEKLEKEIRSNSVNIPVYISAANAYTQKIRDTGDASYYTNIDEILSKAEKIEPQNADILAERASLENGRHN